MPILQKLFGRWTSRREVWIAVPCSATRLLHWTSCRQKVPNFGENYRPVPIPPWNHWKAASARLSTPKRPTTWCQAEIPKTLKHPTINSRCQREKPGTDSPFSRRDDCVFSDVAGREKGCLSPVFTGRTG